MTPIQPKSREIQRCTGPELPESRIQPLAIKGSGGRIELLRQSSPNREKSSAVRGPELPESKIKPLPSKEAGAGSMIRGGSAQSSVIIRCCRRGRPLQTQRGKTLAGAAEGEGFGSGEIHKLEMHKLKMHKSEMHESEICESGKHKLMQMS